MDNGFILSIFSLTKMLFLRFFMRIEYKIDILKMFHKWISSSAVLRFAAKDGAVCVWCEWWQPLAPACCQYHSDPAQWYWYGGHMVTIPASGTSGQEWTQRPYPAHLQPSAKANNILRQSSTYRKKSINCNPSRFANLSQAMSHNFISIAARQAVLRKPMGPESLWS